MKANIKLYLSDTEVTYDPAATLTLIEHNIDRNKNKQELCEFNAKLLKEHIDTPNTIVVMMEHIFLRDTNGKIRYTPIDPFIRDYHGYNDERKFSPIIHVGMEYKVDTMEDIDKDMLWVLDLAEDVLDHPELEKDDDCIFYIREVMMTPALLTVEPAIYQDIVGHIEYLDSIND